MHKHQRNESALSRLLQQLISGDSKRTTHYIIVAPEVFRRERYTQAVDIFNIGILLYQIFTNTILQNPLAQKKLLKHYFKKRKSKKSNLEKPNLEKSWSELFSEGYRPRFPQWLPNDAIYLISDCWQSDMTARPDIEAVKDRLFIMRVSGILKKIHTKSRFSLFCGKSLANRLF